MKSLFRLCLFGLPCLLGGQLALGAVENDIDKEFIVETRTVVDQAKVNQMLADSVAQLKERYQNSSAMVKNATELLSNLGGKCPDQCKVLAEALIDWMASENQKDAADVKKDFAKGKLSKKMEPIVYEYLRAEKNNEERSCALLNAIEKSSVENWITIRNKPTVTVIDTIPNPTSRTALYKDGKIKDILKSDVSDICHGWEWVYSRSESPERVSKSYPKSVSYLLKKSHPEYALSGTDDYKDIVIFDMSGKIKQVLPLSDVTGWGQNSSKIEKQIFKHSYDSNAYGIQSEGATVRHKIMVAVGVEKMTAAEEAEARKAAKAFGSMLESIADAEYAEQRYGKKSPQARKANDKSFGQIIGVMFGGAEDKESGIAGRWKEQIRDDWKRMFDHPYKLTQLSPSSFRVLYVDKDGVPSYAVVRKFINRGDFEYEVDDTIEFLKETKSLFTAVAEPKPMIVEPQEIDNQKQAVEDPIYTTVEVKPAFPGGETAMYKWIGENMKYPEQANGRSGRIVVKLVIERDGSVTNPQIVRGDDPFFKEEVMRLALSMPKWTPGQMNGKPVRVYHTIPMTFRGNR